MHWIYLDRKSSLHGAGGCDDGLAGKTFGPSCKVLGIRV